MVFTDSIYLGDHLGVKVDHSIECHKSLEAKEMGVLGEVERVSIERLGLFKRGGQK